MAAGDEKTGGFGSRGPFHTANDSDDDDEDEDVTPSVVDITKKRARGQAREFMFPDVQNAGLVKPSIPPRAWLLGNSFCRKFLSMAIGKGGAGKSALRLTQLIAAALGRGDLVGEHVFVRCKVLLVSLEDNSEELDRRIKAACDHHGIDQTDLDGWLYYWTPKNIRLAEHDEKTGEWTRGRLWTEVRDRVRHFEIDIVAIDPLARAHGGVENDNMEMDFVAGLMVELAEDCNIAIDLTHHTRKGEAEAGDADAARGAVAFINAARLAYTVTTMTPSEAAKFSVEDDKRKSFIRLDNAKVNLAPPSESAHWFRLVGVALGNATAAYPEGDNVQAVERWAPPDPIDRLTPEIARKILQRLREGYPGKKGTRRYSGAANAGVASGAWALVQAHIPIFTKQQAQGVVNDWLINGVIEQRDYLDPDQRHVVPGLFVLRPPDDIYN